MENTHAPAREPPVNLDNCDREPIHVPGSIQPTGCLLAFDQAGTLVAWSDNVPQLLSFTPTPAATVTSLPLAAEVAATLHECLTDLGSGAEVTPIATETSLAGQEYDFIAHAFNGRVIAEFELRDRSVDEVAAFALKAHRGIDRLKRQRSIEDLLARAVEEVQQLTGFDRVMAYRFRHDDSGDVVAEVCRPGLEPYLGRRYPASDIPAQARRLYTINTLRIISDIGYTPVPIVGWSNEPLDMSHCVLRSVSPIHIEYLQNMGVGASMSVSIVVNGRLWGMLACHHMTARRVPFSIRMACDVLAQVIAANVQAIDSRQRAVRVESAASNRARLLESLLQEEDVLRAIEKHADTLRSSLGAEALIATQFGKSVQLGAAVPQGLAVHIVASLPRELSLIQRTQLEDWDESIHPDLGPWVGLLALRFDPATEGTLLALRREQIETVRWGGKPEKEMRVGPLGARLTPRGSFAEWREVVRGKAEPWDETHLLIARQLLAEMQRVSNARHAETERARTQLLAMLGHDLRDPLQSITMAAAVLERGQSGERLTRRIQASSNRMQRLIGSVLDVSRIESGLGLGLSLCEDDLSRIVNDIVDESRTAHPGMDYVVSVPPALRAHVDRDRFGQVISNLISNARHHGQPNRPIRIELLSRDGHAVVRVLNEAEPIDPAVEATLFTAFKERARRNERNPTGMGLGLHIAQQIVLGHGGSLRYGYESPHVVFTVQIPLDSSSAGDR